MHFEAVCIQLKAFLITLVKYLISLLEQILVLLGDVSRKPEAVRGRVIFKPKQS